MTGNWTFTTAALTKLFNGTFDIDSNAFKVALFLSTSNIGAGSGAYSAVTNEHANANGYSTGGIAISLGLSGTTLVAAKGAVNPIWTASGGSITARFAVIYKVGGDVLCWCLLDTAPADVTKTDGNSLEISIGGTESVFTAEQG